MGNEAMPSTMDSCRHDFIAKLLVSFTYSAASTNASWKALTQSALF